MSDAGEGPHRPGSWWQLGPAATVLAALLPLLLLLPPLQATALAVPDPGAAPREPPILSAEEFLRRVVDEGVDDAGIVIAGDLDLRGVGRVERLLRCRDCTVRGSVNAADVVFTRVVDLSGLRVEGALDLHGATVEQAFLLQDSQRRGARIDGATDLDLVTFADLAAFDGARFRGPFRAHHLRVTGAASFAGTAFSQAARFDDASFAGAATFAGGSFEGEARFVRSRFAGPASFQQRRFAERATFTGAAFERRVDFTLAEFRGPGRFENLTLEQDASFRVIQALAPMTFQQSRAGGRLDFQGAVFQQQLSLSGVASAGELSLLDVTIGASRGLLMEPMFPSTLLIDIATIEQIPGARVRARALTTLEETAKARGDLALANDARYTLLSLQSEQHRGLPRLLDHVFYRGVSGYLVRPQHPLLTLALLIGITAAIRAVPAVRAARAQGAAAGRALPRGWRRYRLQAEHTLGPVVGSLHASLSRTFRRKGAATDDPPEGASPFVAGTRALESTAVKVLLVVLLLTLGNSNATIREVVDALRG